MKVVIADDEPLARDLIRNLLAGEDGVRIVGEAKDADQTLALVRSQNPDLVFLDIQMPGMSGVEAACRMAGDGRPLIVFATAHATHAADAFDLDAADYLLKPIRRERLAEALERARRRLERAGAGRAPTAEAPRGDAIWVAARHGQVRVPLGEVSHIVAARDHVFLHVDGRAWMHRATMAGIETLAVPHGLVRIHRSVMVRPSRVEAVVQAGRSLRVRLDCGADLPVGPAYRARVRGWTLT